jgi:hypothetical protein
MGASLAVCLSDAWWDALALSIGAEGDPLRLELPPDGTGDDAPDPRAAAVLGSLYLVSELDQLGVVASAELLAAERWNLGVRDRAAAAALERFASDMRDLPDAAMRSQLFARLFGASPPSPSGAADAVARAASASRNDAFEELLAGYCQAITAVREHSVRHAAVGLRLAGDRLRANLAPRQYGNTMIVARSLVEQVRAALGLLAMPGIGQLFGTTGAWGVLRALHASEAGDIGRRVDRGRSGQTVIASTGHPPLPDLVDAALADAAGLWLAATGFGAEAVER